MPRRKSRPPRTENRFRQREIARSIRGAEDAGKDVERVEIDPATGRIHLILAKGENSDAPVGAKAWDDALTKLKEKPEQASRSAPTRRR